MRWWHHDSPTIELEQRFPFSPQVKWRLKQPSFCWRKTEKFATTVVLPMQDTVFLLTTHSHKAKRPVQMHEAFYLVGEGGFEPPKAKPADLQSVPFGHSGTLPNRTTTMIAQQNRFVKNNFWLFQSIFRDAFPQENRKSAWRGGIILVYCVCSGYYCGLVGRAAHA